MQNIVTPSVNYVSQVLDPLIFSILGILLETPENVFPFMRHQEFQLLPNL